MLNMYECTEDQYRSHNVAGRSLPVQRLVDTEDLSADRSDVSHTLASSYLQDKQQVDQKQVRSLWKICLVEVQYIGEQWKQFVVSG